jgi:hypothetical protein
MKPRYRFLVPLIASLVIPFGLVGAQTASAKTPVKPAPKTRLLPANLSCSGLLKGPEWGPHVATIDNSSDPCTFGIPDEVALHDPQRTAHVTGGELSCSASVPYKATNLLPKFINAGTGKQHPDFTPHELGMDGEIFFGEGLDDAQSVPPSSEVEAYLQVRNAICNFLVEGTTNVNPPNAEGLPPQSWGYVIQPLLKATRGLLGTVNAELGG